MNKEDAIINKETLVVLPKTATDCLNNQQRQTKKIKTKDIT